MARDDRSEQVIVSYLTLRRIIGVLGVSLPLIVALWAVADSGSWEVLPSISDYYSLRTRDALVGILFAIAFFLLAYRGHERKDDVAGDLACIFALGVALFPNSGNTFERVVHFASAAALFLVLAYFSMFLFTKSGGSMTPRKRMRNVVYRTCGVTMVGCIALIGLYSLLPANTGLSGLKPVFWLEALALWAFGLSWFVKGETLLRDQGA